MGSSSAVVRFRHSLDSIHLPDGDFRVRGLEIALGHFASPPASPLRSLIASPASQPPMPAETPASTTVAPASPPSLALGKIEQLDDKAAAAMLVSAYKRITDEMGKFIVGQQDVLEQLVIAVLAGGHCLLEGVPGLAKTAMIRSLSRCHGSEFSPHPVYPGPDACGYHGYGYHPGRSCDRPPRSFVFQKGPIFAQMLLADEINRTPPKTQAALLEAMQEHSVTVGRAPLKLEEPFFVLATQNPIEQEGTYPLPEAQKDRFIFLVRVDYPDREHERQIMARTTGTFTADLQPVIHGDADQELQRVVRKVPVPEHVMDFVLDLVRFTRPNNPDAPAFVQGPGLGGRPSCLPESRPRGQGARVLRGRFHVTDDDIDCPGSSRPAPPRRADIQCRGRGDQCRRHHHAHRAGRAARRVEEDPL